MQELLLKTCTNSAWSKRSLELNRVWDRTAALSGVSISTTQKIVEEKKKAQDEQQQAKQPPSSTSKVPLGDQGVVQRTIARRRFCQPLITSEQSSNRVLVTLAARGRLRKDLLHMKFTYTRCEVNRKVLMERQDVVLSRIRYLRRSR